jgi:hypothetical protein
MSIGAEHAGDTRPDSHGEALGPWAHLLVAVAFAGGPAAYVFHLLVSYLLVPLACRQGTWVLHATTAVSVAGVLGVGALAWRLWRQAGRRGPADEGGRPSGVGLLAIGGLGLAAFFAVVIVLNGAANALVDPCARPAGI